MPKAKSKVEIKNRRASFDYEFIDTYVAGIVLTGTEIKSIRAGKASLVDGFCYFNNGELYVKNMHVAEYHWGSWGKHDPRRDRKLLLKKKELDRLQRAVKEKGLTIVAVRLFIPERESLRALNRAASSRVRLKVASRRSAPVAFRLTLLSTSLRIPGRKRARCKALRESLWKSTAEALSRLRHSVRE